MLAKINSAEEHKPCAIIIRSPPVNPHCVIVIAPAISSPIWPTDEQAIIDFISGCRRQINPVTTAPTNEMLMIELDGSKGDFRM